MLKMILTAMFGAIILTTAIAKGLSILLGLSSIVCGTPVLVAVVFGTIWLVLKCRYRPEENHLGVLYCFGRFSRFVPPDEWVFLIPLVYEVHHEVSLYMCTADLSLSNIELGDGLVVDARLKVFFRTDPRLASQENLLQVLKFQGVEWSEMVKTSTEDIVRNQIFLNLTYAQMIDFRKNREIKRLLSKEVAERMKGFGIVINEGHGVMPVAIQPNQMYQDAVQASRAATPIGEAALERLLPVLDAMKKFLPENAQAALLLEVASKIVETGQLPEIVLSPSSEIPISLSRGNGNGHRPPLAWSASKDLPFAK